MLEAIHKNSTKVHTSMLSWQQQSIGSTRSYMTTTCHKIKLGRNVFRVSYLLKKGFLLSLDRTLIHRRLVSQLKLVLNFTFEFECFQCLPASMFISMSILVFFFLYSFYLLELVLVWIRVKVRVSIGCISAVTILLRR